MVEGNYRSRASESEQCRKHHTRASFSMQATDNKSSWHLLSNSTKLFFQVPQMLNLYIQCTNFDLWKEISNFCPVLFSLTFAIELLVFKVKVYILPRLWHSHVVLGITVPRSGSKQPFTTTTEQSNILLAAHNCKEAPYSSVPWTWRHTTGKKPIFLFQGLDSQGDK